MMQNKQRSGGSDQCLRGINVRSGCGGSLGGGRRRLKTAGKDANKTNENEYGTSEAAFRCSG